MDHAPWLTLRMVKGNNGGLFSPSVLAGPLISPFSSSMGGVTVMPEGSYISKCGAGACVCRGLELLSTIPGRLRCWPMVER